MRGLSGGAPPPYHQRLSPPSGEVFDRQSSRRIERLCRRAVSAMSIDLSGQKVLTEAATGPFATTAVLAALAGAEVRAVTRDSRWGLASDAIAQVRALAEQCGVAHAIAFFTEPPADVAESCDLVTNLGFVRPIGREIIARLSNVSAVSLMWEPWELRADEIDLAALRDHGVALVATNEQHPHVRTFDYLGPTVGRLLFDAGIEIVNSRLAVLGSDPFGSAIGDWLTAAGATVAADSGPFALHETDAVILAEHRDHAFRFGNRPGDDPAALAANGVPVIRLSGGADIHILEEAGVALYPSHAVPSGTMAVTTAYAGPRPVIDLHAAGLKAGGDVVRARRGGATIAEALRSAVANGYGLTVEG